MIIPEKFGFYAILTNPRTGFEYLTKLLVDHGVRFVQLRMKDSSRDEVLRTANLMRKLTLNSGTSLIINDFPEIAQQCGADGVHVGQGDMAYDRVREIVGPEALIGISTHSPDQVSAACALKPDYIGIGPVFATPTKKNPDPVIGLNGMKSMLTTASVPVVAIGGINLLNLNSVLENGAVNFCMVRQLTDSEHPEEVLKKFVQIYRQYHPLF